LIEDVENSGIDRYAWENLINRWIFSEIDRKILKRKILDDVSLERIAEEVGVSVTTVKRRHSKAFKKLVKKL